MANRVYGICHLHGDHWAAYEIDLISKAITVADSMYSPKNLPAVLEQFDAVSRYIPWLCRKAGLWKLRGVPEDTRTEWPVIAYEGAAQQNNSHDCGIMAMQYIEHLVANLSLSSIVPTKCESPTVLRYFIVVGLYEQTMYRICIYRWIDSNISFFAYILAS